MAMESETPENLAALACFNRGIELTKLNQPVAAVASYRRALELNPELAEGHNNLGNVLRSLGQIDAAVKSYERALEIAPCYAGACLNLGNAQMDLGRLEAAIASYRKAIELSPDLAAAHLSLGGILDFIGQPSEAVNSYSRALAIKPGNAKAYCGLGHAFVNLGEVDDAIAHYRRALEINPHSSATHSGLLFIENYAAKLSNEQLLKDAKQFGERLAQKTSSFSSWKNTPDKNRLLRVGFVSGDFCQHPVGELIEGILATLASRASDTLELFAYSTHFRSDDLTAQIKSHCHRWCLAQGLSDKQLAEQIRRDGIDILIDLSGHTSHNRLSMFAWKPAPVQVTWLGYPNTTGLSAMDYIIADSWTLPKEQEPHFVEKVCRLPETYACFSPPERVPVGSLPAIENGYITFGSYNKLAKLNSDVIELWSRVLLEVPKSRLRLKGKGLMDPELRQRITSRFEAHGIASNRLILANVVPRTEYLSEYNKIDICLDPFPYGGTTTTMESLWMGVPVLTLAGDRFFSRQGVGLLMNAGLSEWIAKDRNAYVALASKHASNFERLALLRSHLRGQLLDSPLYGQARFAGHFAAALRWMWGEWCDKVNSSI